MMKATGEHSDGRDARRGQGVWEGHPSGLPLSQHFLGFTNLVALQTPCF